jgi:very-short-patch-repair endonuclease
MREFATQHHGLVRRADLQRFGIGERMRHHMSTTGEIVLVSSGVYRLGGVPWTWESDLLGLCWAQSPQGWVSHRSAARLWGATTFNDRVLDVIVTRHARRPGVNRQLRLHETKLLLPMEMSIVRNIPVTSPARTIVDVAAVASEERVEYLVETMQRLGHCDIDEIEEAVRRLAAPGRRGGRKLRAVMERQGRHERQVDSPTNVRLRTHLVRAGLGEPEYEFPISVAGHTYLADLAYPTSRLLIECVSVAFHVRGESYDRDSVRRHQLMEAGWTVLEFTWNQVFRESEMVVATVRKWLARQNPREA